MGFTAELETGTKAIAELVDRAEAEAPDIVDRGSAAGRARGPARGDRLHPHLDRQDGPADQRDPEAVARGAAHRSRPSRSTWPRLIGGIRDTLQHRLDETGGEIVDRGRAADDRQRPAGDRAGLRQRHRECGQVPSIRRARSASSCAAQSAGRARSSRSPTTAAASIRAITHRVFDLFRRSGTQDQPGEGIGLAHVRALTYRLGGTIDVASHAGRGCDVPHRPAPHASTAAGPST